MNNNFIIVYFQPFAIDSNVILVKDGNKQSYYFPNNSFDLANELMKLAYAANVYNVKLEMPIDFSIGFIEILNNLEQNTYSTNKIDIEVI